MNLGNGIAVFGTEVAFHAFSLQDNLRPFSSQTCWFFRDSFLRGAGVESIFSTSPTRGAMWTFLVLALVSSAASETARCQKNGAPVFLQFGTRFSQGSMTFSSQGEDPDDFPEEHPDVPYCYGSFGAVAAQEGESLGSGMKDVSLADCKRACNSQEMSEVLPSGNLT